MNIRKYAEKIERDSHKKAEDYANVVLGIYNDDKTLAFKSIRLLVIAAFESGYIQGKTDEDQTIGKNTWWERIFGKKNYI